VSSCPHYVLGAEKQCVESCAAAGLAYQWEAAPGAYECVESCPDHLGFTDGATCVVGCPAEKAYVGPDNACLSTCASGFISVDAAMVRCLDSHSGRYVKSTVYPGMNEVLAGDACNATYPYLRDGRECVAVCATEQAYDLALNCLAEGCPALFYVNASAANTHLCVSECAAEYPYQRESQCSKTPCSHFRRSGSVFICMDSCAVEGYGY
jgi:hypothetical protein